MTFSEPVTTRAMYVVWVIVYVGLDDFSTEFQHCVCCDVVVPVDLTDYVGDRCIPYCSYASPAVQVEPI